jgi:hypothetical protein
MAASRGQRNLLEQHANMALPNPPSLYVFNDSLAPGQASLHTDPGVRERDAASEAALKPFFWLLGLGLRDWLGCPKRLTCSTSSSWFPTCGSFVLLATGVKLSRNIQNLANISTRFAS